MSIELTRETSIDLLKRYIDAGYKNTGSLSIKEGAAVHRFFRVLKKQEELSEEEKGKITDKDIYKMLFRVLDSFNSAKAYTLDDAAVIDKIVTFIEASLEAPPVVADTKGKSAAVEV